MPEAEHPADCGYCRAGEPMEHTYQPLDMEAAYAVAGHPGVAFSLRGYAFEVVVNDVIVCEDEECDHGLSDMCWTVDLDEVEDRGMVRAVMVGDDREHLVDVSDLTQLTEDTYCRECGQIGCAHDGRVRA